MPSPPLNCTHDRTPSAVACHHSPWTAHTVRRSRAWHDITSLRQHTRSNDVGRGMTSPPLGSTHDRQRHSWHDITALGHHTRSNDIGRYMTSPPLDSTHGRTMTGVASHHRFWAAQTVERRRAWYDNTAIGQHTQSNEVGCGMTSPPLDGTHCRYRRAWHDITTFGQHTQLNIVRRGMPSSPLGSTHGRMKSGVGCHHRLWAAQTVERRRACHDITSLGRHARSDDVGRGITSPLLDCKQSRQRRVA